MPIKAEQIQFMIDKYMGGDSLGTIALACGYSRETVKKTLVKSGVVLRSRMEIITKYHPNHSAFNTIDTEESAYWLGFIASDGCVMGNTLNIALSDVDKTHLEKFAQWFSPGYPIRTYKTKQGYGQSRFYATSTEATSALATYGVVPRKTWSFSHIPNIDKNFIKHFLRGYLDGDGWITKDKDNIYKTGFCGANHVFLAEIQDWLNAELGLREATIVRTGKVWVYPKAGKQAIIVLDYLYSGATVYLDRKYVKAIEAVTIRNAICQRLGLTIEEYSKYRKGKA